MALGIELRGARSGDPPGRSDEKAHLATGDGELRLERCLKAFSRLADPDRCRRLLPSQPGRVARPDEAPHLSTTAGKAASPAAPQAGSITGNAGGLNHRNQVMPAHLAVRQPGSRPTLRLCRRRATCADAHPARPIGPLRAFRMRGFNGMPDAKELLHSNLHEVFSERTLDADGRPSSGPIRKT